MTSLDAIPAGFPPAAFAPATFLAHCLQLPAERDVLLPCSLVVRWTFSNAVFPSQKAWMPLGQERPKTAVEDGKCNVTHRPVLSTGDWPRLAQDASCDSEQ